MNVRDDRRSGSRTGIARAAIAVGALFALGACAATTKFKPLNEAYVLTVPIDTKGCPGKPSFDLNCGAGHEDCTHARRGHKVSVVSSPAGKSFALQFDPFGASKIDVNGQASFTVSQSAKLGTYTFVVVGPQDCPAADPQIILE